ncbi:GYD domain-containing protein [Actinoallomurus sp. NPDC052308]|uniref:GYD domain-containing protein n=1 Tax=Actinoallomurus sp. NPDC052308 TaxID=3155530 RepID=UPI00344A8979
MLLSKWTDLGRREAATLPDRVAEVTKHLEEMGGKVLGFYLTMGEYDQVGLIETPDEEVAARFAVFIAGRGYVVSETLRCFSMDEMRSLT